MSHSVSATLDLQFVDLVILGGGGRLKSQCPHGMMENLSWG